VGANAEIKVGRDFVGRDQINANQLILSSEERKQEFATQIEQLRASLRDVERQIGEEDVFTGGRERPAVPH